MAAGGKFKYLLSLLMRLLIAGNMQEILYVVFYA